MYNIKLSDLETSRDYFVKIRAKVVGYEDSEWSIPYRFTTPRDTMPPSHVRNLEFISEGDSFIANWLPPEVNEDGTPCADISHYNLEFTDLDRDITVTRKVSDTEYKIDLNQNMRLFGSARPAGHIKIVITVEDFSGNVSVARDAIAQNPPPAQIKNVKAEPGMESISVSWDESEDSDIMRYEFHVGSEDEFELTSDTHRANIAFGSSSHVFDTSSIVSQYFNIVAVDKFWQKSIPSNYASAQPRLSTDFDTTPPGAVTGFEVHQVLATDSVSAVAQISFNALPDEDMDKYEIQYRKTGETTLPWNFTNIPSDETTAEIQGLALGTDYDFRIRGVDFLSNKGTWSNVIVAEGVKKTSLPDAPTNVSVNGGATNLMITWSESTDETMSNWSGTYEVEIDQSDDFSDSTSVKTSSTLASFTSLESNTVYYVRVRSIDPYNNIGDWSEVVSGNTGTTFDPNAPQIYWSVLPPSEGKENDLWIKLPQNVQYRYDGSEWVKAQDSEIVDMVEDAQNTADSKRQVFGGDTEPSSSDNVLSVNDLWIQDSTGKMFRWSGDDWIPAQDYRIEAALLKGNNLVINGHGELGNNNNWPGFDYDGSDSPPGSSGSFISTSKRNVSATENIAIDPNASYKVSVWARRLNDVKDHAYMYLAPYDAYGRSISPQSYAYRPGSTTQLTKDLEPGDTSIEVESTENWYVGDSTNYYVTFWDYVDEGGKAWGKETYTRNYHARIYDADVESLPATSIPLIEPWSGDLKPAGTWLSSGLSGGTYMYQALSRTELEPEWTYYNSGIVGGIHDGSTGGARDHFPVATATVKVGFLANHSDLEGSAQAFSGINFSDVTAAIDIAGSAMQSANARNRNIYSTSSARGSSLDGYDFVDGDTWYRRDGNNTILDMWEFRNGTWVSKTLNDAVIANLDAGKITSGYINAERIDADTITGTMIQSQTIEVGNMAEDSVDRTVIKDGEIVTGKIAAEAITAEEIAGNAITADKILAGEIKGEDFEANTALVNDLQVQSSITINSADGHIKSDNFTANGDEGFYMDQQQLIINQGRIKASALELQNSPNIADPAYASFGYSDSYYKSNIVQDGYATVGGSNSRYGQSRGLRHNGGGKLTLETDDTLALLAGEKYIVSIYVKQEFAHNLNQFVSIGLIIIDSESYYEITGDSRPVQDDWRRLEFTYEPPEDSWAFVTLNYEGGEHDSITWSALQIERVTGALEEASPWTPPGFTSINGAAITTGSISSFRISEYGDRQQPMWSINTEGNARFADALVTGKLIVGGYGTEDPETNEKTSIQSDSYDPGNTGWAIKGNGDVEFNDGTFRGELNLQRSGVVEIPLNMTISVSEIEAYTTATDYNKIDTANIRGVLYGYKRTDNETEGVYLPTEYDPDKKGHFFIGPTTERALNIQVHDGGDGDKVYLSTPPDNITLTSFNLGEQTESSSEPAIREDQGFSFRTYRNETRDYNLGGYSTENVDNITLNTYSAITQEKSAVIPEDLMGDGEYPSSRHIWVSSNRYETPEGKNLLDDLIVRGQYGIVGSRGTSVLTGIQTPIPGQSGYGLTGIRIQQTTETDYLFSAETPRTSVPTSGPVILSFYVNTEDLDEGVYIGAQIGDHVMNPNEVVDTGSINHLNNGEWTFVSQSTRSKRVSFYHPNLAAGSYSVRLRFSSSTPLSLVSQPIYIAKLQLEQAAYKNDSTLQDEITESYSPTPWTTNGAAITTAATFELRSEPNVHPEDNQIGAGDRSVYPSINHGTQVQSSTEAVLNFRMQYQSPFELDHSVASSEYRFSPAGITYPGTHVPFMPTSATILYDYRNEDLNNRPNIGGGHSAVTGNSQWPIRLGSLKEIRDNFSSGSSSYTRNAEIPGWSIVGQNVLLRVKDGWVRTKSREGGGYYNNFYIYRNDAMDDMNHTVSMTMNPLWFNFGLQYYHTTGGPVINLDPSTGSRISVEYTGRNREYDIVQYYNHTSRVVIATGTLDLHPEDRFTLALTREDNTIRLDLNGRNVRSVQSNSLPTSGRHVGMSPVIGLFKDFHAYPSKEPENATGYLSPRSINVNNGRGMTVNQYGLIRINHPGIYHITVSLAPNSRFGGDSDDHYQIYVRSETQTGEYAEPNLIISQDAAQYAGGILRLHGSGVGYLSGDVIIYTWTNDPGPPKIDEAYINVTRLA